MKRMQSLPQWVTWDRSNGDKAPRKVDGSFASSTNSGTWSNFDTAVSGGRGVGFVVTEDDDYIFIDLDHVLNSDRTFKDDCEWASNIVDAMDTYWEVSPSGDGLHGFVKGTLPIEVKNKVYFNDKKSILEVYHKERYSTITTDVFTGDGVVKECDLSEILKHLDMVPQVVSILDAPVQVVSSGSALSDDEVVQRMDAEGHWLVGVGAEGNSEIDAAFISHLSFWCGGDEAQIERLALSNPLARAKWDRKQSGGTFLQYAIKGWRDSGKAEYYTPSASVIDIPFSDMTKAEVKLAVKEEKKESKRRAVSAAIDKWLISNKAHIWFDEETEKYCLKRSTHINYFSKNGFMQFFLSSCGAKLKGGDIKVDTLRSDYRPDMDEFFIRDGMQHINTFTPSPLMNIESGAEMPVMIGKLLGNLFEEKEQLDQFLNWLAYIYQYRVRTQTAWVFAGKQGTGKGVLVDYIIKGIWKHNAVCNLTDSHLESQFNPYMQDKMFVHFNEISADTKKSRVAVKNRLKTWLTDETIFINSKGIKEVERSNFCNLIMNSNEHIPIDIDTGDRRFNVVRTDHVLTETSWFIKRDSVDAMVKELPGFASFLAGYDVDKKLAGSVVMSKLKEELIQAVKTLPEQIADAFKSRDFNFFIDCDIEGWIDGLNGFNTPKLDEVEQRFSEDFVPNKIISLLVSAAFKRNTDMRNVGASIFKRFNFGENHRISSERGWIF